MKRFLMLVVVLVPMTVAGCGRPQLVAEASLSDPGTGERLALGDLPIRLLPYDRDAIFDSLEAAFDRPEPPIPPEIMARQQEVQAAQQQWTTLEQRWLATLDSLRILNDQMSGLSRGSPQYAQLFASWTPLDARRAALDRERDQAFQRFTNLQEQVFATAQEIRAQRELWAEEAFADFNRVVAAKLRESGREEYADTTNAQGFARFRAPAGRWWVYSRYTLPTEELYWNIPVEIAGDSTHVPLTRENAEVRPIL